MIMDEPPASLIESDVKWLMVVIKQQRERDVGIVYVS